VTTYYVDYAAGSDANSGTSISSPWQHAPGDPNATGNAKIILIGGAKVLFKAGVVYGGSITVQSSGTPGNPIVYEGIGWGEGKATLSGLTTAEVTFTSYPDNPNLSVATLAPWMKPNLSNVVEIDGKVAWMANNSTSPNPYTPDIGAMSFSPSQMTGSGTSWTFTDPKVSTTLSSANPSIIPNLIFRTYLFGNNYRNLNVTGYDPNTGALSLSGGFLMPNTPYTTSSTTTQPL
jgi:hypothetical protein